VAHLGSARGQMQKLPSGESFMTSSRKKIEGHALLRLQPMDFKLGMFASRWH
jgi:hypothetical protein